MIPVVRFAPSPTGWLHVGGLRTALYNYLFARQSGGKFILRIEDTDKTRYVPGAVDKLIESLKQMGINYDAGPGKNDDFGPYIQSERLPLYHKEAQRLLENAKAYRCFCSSERLEALRSQQIARGEAPGYDGKCRSISPAESNTLADKEPFVIRLKTPLSGEISFKDIIRGNITVEYSKIDDQVLMKSDGYPTYHLANVVDDHYMEVSHVIRGEEWLPSLPKHLLLYQYLGWNPPLFAHLPLLLNSDRSKLSKRQGDVAVEDYLLNGYLPEALNNYLALLGWNPGTDEEFFSMAQLIELFSLERVNKSGAVFDPVKLKWMNSRYIQQLSPEKITKIVEPFIKNCQLTSEKTAIIVPALQNNIQTLSDMPDEIKKLQTAPQKPNDDEALTLINAGSTRLLFEAFIQECENLQIMTALKFKETMKLVQKRHSIKGKLLWMPIRLALTGEMHGPDLASISAFLDVKEITKRMKAALLWLS
ncbi:MAG TPA: glutamate--tRNA ligase [Candidatus Marinimicrobia bacterium]|nr:glutamate--tRNA ligase [Candidatus Neomarinimicrobiota bacterium]